MTSPNEIQFMLQASITALTSTLTCFLLFKPNYNANDLVVQAENVLTFLNLRL